MDVSDQTIRIRRILLAALPIISLLPLLLNTRSSFTVPYRNEQYFRNIHLFILYGLIAAFWIWVLKEEKRKVKYFFSISSILVCVTSWMLLYLPGLNLNIYVVIFILSNQVCVALWVGLSAFVLLQSIVESLQCHKDK